jgi:molybdopterin-guanine dinucleotide biosynthesis protein A
VTRPAPAPDFDTVILAGGRAARMGGADKPGLTATDTPMLVSVARAAAAAGTARLVVVGPARPGAVQAALAALAAGRHGWLTCVQEHPPGGGPVAGLRRGLAEVSAPRVALLAADLPFLTGADLMRLLTADVSGDAVGLVLADAEGRPQWLASCWQSPTLRAAAAGYDGDSLHGLLAPLRPTPAPVLALARPDTAGATMPPWLDCDTPDDLAAARRAWLAKAADSGGQR